MDCASVRPKQTAKIAQKLLASPAGSPYAQLTWFRVKEVDDFMRVSLLLGIFAMTASTVAHAGGSTALSYPETRKLDVIEEQFGVKVADPFRWLEDDVRVNPAVAEWVAGQNQVSRAYLSNLPGRDALKARMKALFDYQRYGLPQKAGGRYFFTKNDGLQNQSPLYYRNGLRGKDRVLIDPNAWAKDAATALDQWEPSPDGKLLAYAIQDGGSDWRTIKVVDVKTGAQLGDEIRWAKFTNIAWVGNEGFLYSRFAEPAKGQEFQALNENQTLYFHRIGTSQAEDIAIYATLDRPKLGHSAQVTHDNRWVVITSSKGTDEKYEITLIPISNGKGKTLPIDQWKPRTLVPGLDHDWQLVEGVGNQLWFITNKDAPKLKIVRVDLGDGEPVFKDVVPERSEPLARAQIVGDRLVLSYLQNATSIAEMTALDGTPLQTISLNSIGTASGFSGKPGDPETFYAFSSFNQPSTIYRFNSLTGKSSIFGRPELSFDPASIAIEQHFYVSKDGTKVPMFIVHKKDLDLSKGAPTLLYAYGGFNVAQLPTFDARRMAWIESGGVFALANIRGGSEYGKAWHDAGRLLNKQNVFDDFIAAGEYLIQQGISAKGKLAIEGRSNGGLLVGAVVNQRPDLFAAGHAAVGVMDMLRFDRFTAGRYWVDDYGYPNKETDFRNLLGYSPYHNIKSGVEYPAMIVTTADTDDRVVPGHSFKYTAALQAANAGPKPHIIRIETRAGHGSGKPTDKLIEEYSDVYGFLAKWTGLELEDDAAK